MAPPAMFSYLRPHHKRDKTQSNSTSPVVPPQLPHGYPLQQTTGPFTPAPPPSQIPDNDSLHSNSPISPKPSLLPSTPRISSRHELPRGSAAGEASALGSAVQGNDQGQRDVNISQTLLADTTFAKEPNDLSATKSNDMGQLFAHKSLAQESTDRPDTRSSTNTSSSHENQQRPGPLTQSSFSASKVFQSHRRPSSPAASGNTSSGAKSSSSASSSVQPPKSGRGKLNLLNPMSLLMRRRSSQAVGTLPGDSMVNNRNYPMPSMGLPDDYDPRIRGKVVHDFSAPRPRRIISYGGASPDTSMQPPPKTSIQSGDALHFGNEQLGFEDGRFVAGERDYERGASFTKHANVNIWPQIAQTRHPQMSEPLQYDSEQESPVQRPTLGTPFSETPPNLYTPENESKEAGAATSAAPLPERNSSLDNRLTSRQPSTTEPRFKSLGLPTHMTSNASRFSFDMGGVGSAAQEKLLEEKHKRRAALSKAEVQKDADDEYDEIDDVPEDMYDFDDTAEGIEEEVPEFNVDADEQDAYGASQALGAFDFSSSYAAASPKSPQNPVDPSDTPLDAHGNRIGVAVTNEKLETVEPGGLGPVRQNEIGHSSGANGLGLHLDLSALPGSVSPAPLMDVPVNTATSHISHDEDDLYFDDGLIEPPPEGISGGFDESVFDDENSHLYSRRKVEVKTEDTSGEPDPASEQTGSTTVVNTTLPSSSPSCYREAPTSGKEATTPPLQKAPAVTDPAELARDKLAAYHDALAAAANKAVAEGKFDRRSSIDTTPSDTFQSPRSVNESEASGVILDDNHYSQEVLFSHPGGLEDTDDDFDFDFEAAMEDDPMIAAANAEALANDAEGVYGQEFGFYPQSFGSADAEYFNGGYFGPRGMDGLIRSHSGRIAFREPNLTPITERSEYSNRNSLVSLSMHGGGGPQSAHTLPSPGLAQLAGMMTPSFEEEMSLGALLKLRRGAWGGSNGSLRSAASGASAPSQASGAASQSNYFSPVSPMPQMNDLAEYRPHDPTTMATATATASDKSSLSPSSSFEYDFSGVEDEDEDEEGKHMPGTGDDGFQHYDNVPGQDLNSTAATTLANLPSFTPINQPQHYSWSPGTPGTAGLTIATASTATAANSNTANIQHQRPRQSFGSSSESQTQSSPISPAVSEPNMTSRHSWSALGPAGPSSPGFRIPAGSTTVPSGPVPPMTPGSPIISTTSSPHHQHHRTSSNTTTESVSYRKEEDERGHDRWVLERRRTDELGAVQIIEREVVQGGI